MAHVTHVIKVTREDESTKFIFGSEKGSAPSVCPSIKNAYQYNTLAAAKNVRDDVLEYFQHADIIRI